MSKDKGIFHSLRKMFSMASHVDIGEIARGLGKMSNAELFSVMHTIKAAARETKAPEIDGDFYQLFDMLTAEQQDIRLKVREFMENEVRPIANEYWLKAEFPMQLIPKIAELDICGLTIKGYGCPGKEFLMEGIVALEMARVDCSISTFLGVQSGLAMGSIAICGSEEQKQKWLPPMRKLEKIGAFGLTEPEVGSAISGGMTMKAVRKGDKWILNGQKKWIGNSTFSDLTIIWAQDDEDQQVKGFIVEKDNPGFRVEKQQDKMALRTVQNGIITLTDCEVAEEDRLQNANSFRDTAKVLRATRAGVAWQAVGCALGAYEIALAYANERKQFGKTISSFQLIQNHLVQMLSHLTAMQTMVFRLSQLQDQGQMSDEQASLAKVVCTQHTRAIVDKAREIFGGNGILIEYDIARFVADAEAIYSYEGTKEINTLIVGRAITGKSAFL